VVERLVFSRSLYAAEAVQAAVAAYEELASFELQISAEAIEVTIREPDESVADVLVDEFCNHALHETIVRQRG
jgi:hypothetical protein